MRIEPKRIWKMSGNPDKDQEPEFTGHEWDGIRECNNPLPRWWLWTLYATIAWGVGYMVAYPALPLIERATPGILGYSTRAELAEDLEVASAANAPLDDRLVATNLNEIASLTDLREYAIRGGAAVFRNYCSQCHGSGAEGAFGYPNLLDDDWIWGGDIEAIHFSVSHGIRDDGDADSRYSEMPAFTELIESDEIDNVTEFVLKLSNQDHDPKMAGLGATVFEEQCSICHGEEGRGDREQGSPNVADAIWIYGGDRETVRQTIANGRFTVMPSWRERLTESQIRQVSVYVHQLGGGE